MNAEFFRFERSILFAFVVLILYLIIRSHQMRHVFWNILSTTKSLDRSGAYKAPKNRKYKEFIFLLGCVLAIFALMRPRWGEKERIRRVNGVDLCIAMDLSNSMMAEDHNPNRLSFAKREITLLLEKLSETKVTLVGFSGGAFIAAPLTSDLEAVGDMLSPLNPDYVSNPSTFIEGALRTCAEALGYKDISEDNENTNPAELSAGSILIVSDGEDSVEVDSDLIKILRKKNIPLYSYLVGSTTKGAQIPIREQDGSIKGFLKNPSTGAVIESKAVDATLKTLAKETRAKVYLASQEADFATSFSKELKQFESKAREEGIEIEKEDQFQIPLLIAFILLVLELFMTETGTLFAKSLLIFIFLNSSQLEAANLWQNLLNNYAVHLSKSGYHLESQKLLQQNFEDSPESREFLYNWLSVRLKKISAELAKEKSKGKEIEAKDNPLAQEAIEVSKILSELLKDKTTPIEKKKTYYQLAQAFELGGQNAPAIESYYEALDGPSVPELDKITKHNLARLLEQQSQSGGKSQGGDGGGGGEGNEGGKGDDSGDQKGKEQKKPQEWKGQSFTPEQVKQIMQNVGSEERSILKKKSRDEARKRAKEWGEGTRGNPW